MASLEQVRKKKYSLLPDNMSSADLVPKDDGILDSQIKKIAAPEVTQDAPQFTGKLDDIQKALPQAPASPNQLSGDEDTNTVLKAILGLAPALVGYALGGNSGGASGAQIGAQTVGDLNKKDDARALASTDYKNISEKQKAKQLLEEGDANSETSKRARNLAREALRTAYPKKPVDEINSTIPDTMSAAEIKESKTLPGLGTAGVNLQGREFMAEQYGARNAILGEGIDIRKEDQAAKAKDKIINGTKLLNQNIQGADRALDILNKPGLTSQEFNDVQIEISNMIAGARSAALGKLERTEYGKSVAQKLQDTLGQLQGKPIESAPPELVGRLRSLANEMRDVFAQQRVEMAKRQKNKYPNNSLAEQQQDEIIKEYQDQAPDKKAQSQPSLSPQDQQAIDWAKQNLNNPDAQKILQLHGIK